VYDLYTGTGTIAQFVSKKKQKKVIGVESVPDAIKDAKANAVRNEIIVSSMLRYESSV
jgi:23S rRNA (uracil1939-C5)-methyltransferase